MLVQMDDKWILTDPFLVDTMGMLQRRASPPGLTAGEIPKIDAVLVSHMHPDHLSFGSLERIERKVKTLLVPQGGLAYIPRFAFDARELRTWRSFDDGGMRITAVPVKSPRRTIRNRLRVDEEELHRLCRRVPRPEGLLRR